MNVLFIINNNKDAGYSISNGVIEFLKEKDLVIYSEDLDLVNKFKSIDGLKFPSDSKNGKYINTFY